MVKIADITDRDSLEVWLDDQPREVSVWIALRAALRVFSFLWDWTVTSSSAKKHDLTALPFLRFFLTSEVARKRPISEIIAAAAADAAAGAAVTATLAAADAARAAEVAAFAAAAAPAPVPAVEVAALAALAAALAATPTFWNSIRADCEAISTGADLDHLPLWADGDNPLAKEWEDLKQQLTVSNPAHPDETARGAVAVDWSFWVKWYDSVLAGTPLNWDMLKEIALIKDEEWVKGPARVNFLIAGIEKKYSGNGTPLSQTSIADFTFDAVKRWMDMIGFEGDVAHLRDPDRVQAFLDDTGELQDGFQDFIDFTQDASTGRNTIAVFTSASDKVLRELQRAKDTQHIRARRLITLGGHLFSFSLEEDMRAELGKTLTRMLDCNVDLLRETCRKHFAPSLERMAPLDNLKLGNADPKKILADLKASLAHIRNADGQDLIPLSSEALAVLNDMVSELEELESAIGEARTDDYRETLHKRFAKGVGGIGATIGRYIEKAKPHSAQTGKWADGAIKNFKRWKTLGDIIEWLGNLWGGGPPSV